MNQETAVRLHDVTTIGILGAGQMGRGIAQVCAAAGYAVLLVDVTDDQAAAALGKIRNSLDRAVELGAMSRSQADAAHVLIHPTAEVERLREAEVVIEAIPEDPSLKRRVFADLGRLCPSRTILASNTSSISIGALGDASGRSDRVIGMHFMNPAPVMRLVEVVCGAQTSAATVNLIRALARRLGKTVVVSKDAPGFIVNRLLMPMINEAVFALEEGIASAEDIDLAMTAGANQPVGPLALADRIGLDTVLAICETLYRELGDPKFRPCPLLQRQVDAGHLGRKTNRGFYQYAAPVPIDRLAAS